MVLISSLWPVHGISTATPVDFTKSDTSDSTVLTPGDFSATITGLTTKFPYSFRTAADAGTTGFTYGDHVTFSTAPVPPTVVTLPATKVTSTTATLNGNLTSLGTATTVIVWFDWGLVGYSRGPTPANITSTTGPFSHNLPGDLIPGYTYHFRARASAINHGTAFGSDMTFTTTALPGVPVVTTSTATKITNNSAVLNGLLTSLGDAVSINVFFEWGPSANYGNHTPSENQTSPGTFSAAISGLRPTTIYHYRARADGSQSGTGYGQPMTFTTLSPPVAPVVTTYEATNISATSATLNGALTSLGTATSVNVLFKWWTGAGPVNTTPPQSMTSIGAFSARIEGLTAGIVYSFQASQMSDTSFTKSFIPSAPLLVEVNSGNPIILSPGGTRSNIPLTVKNIPALSGNNGIGAFQFNLTWNKDVIRVNSLTAATVPGFTTMAGTPNNTAGKAIIIGYWSGACLTADTTVGTISITGVGGAGTASPISVTVVTLGDNNANSLGSMTLGTTVQIASVAAETSLGLATDADGVIVVAVNIDRIKDTETSANTEIPGGIGGYSATAITSPAGGIDLLGVRGTTNSVPSFNASSGTFGLPSTSTPLQPSGTTVARIVPKLVGDCNTAYSLTVSFQSIVSAASGTNIPEERSNTLLFRRGDADGNGVVNIFDAMFIAQYIVGNRPASHLNLLNAAGVKHDGSAGDRIDVFDAMLIAQYVVGNRNARFE